MAQFATPPWLYLNSSQYPYKKALASATSSLLFVLDTYHTHSHVKSLASTKEQERQFLFLTSVVKPELESESAPEESSTCTVSGLDLTAGTSPSTA